MFCSKLVFVLSLLALTVTDTQAQSRSESQLLLSMQWQGMIETTQCFYECFRLFDVNSYFYCNNGSKGYCCAPNSSNANCKTSTCSSSLASKELSYANCFRNNICGDQTITATKTPQSASYSSLTFNNNDACSWKITPSTSEFGAAS